VAGLIVSAGIVSGQLVLGLDSGELITAGYVQGVQGLTGERGPMGATGPAGRDGNTVLHGVGTPQFNDGKDGDLFYSTDQVAIYGPKTNGGWGKPVYLRPQDNKSFTLPTGMKAQGGGGSGRFFAGGISGPSSGGIPAGGGTGGPSPILTNGTPMVAGVPTLIAEDSSGDAMIVDLWAQSAQGTLFTEVAVSKGNGTDTGYSVVYEIQMGVQPPVLTFTPSVTATGGLQLAVSSDVALTTLRGRVLLL
jgi:hypothetical protein